MSAKPYPGPQDIARIDLRLGNGHRIVRGPFKTERATVGGNIVGVPEELWTVSEPARRPAHLDAEIRRPDGSVVQHARSTEAVPAPGQGNDEWLHEIRDDGRFPTAAQAITAACRQIGIVLEPVEVLPPKPKKKKALQ